MKLKNSRTARTPFASALRLARTANRRDTPPADELVEMRRESARPGARAPWTRRRFLKTSAAAAAVTLAGGSVLASRKKNKKKCAKTKGAAPRIAVVGAGLAGLNAAYALKKQGHSAEVYEAAKRMGGRIYTAYDVMAPGLFAELGGEWVNEDHEEVLSLVKELGLELSDLNAPSERDLLSSNYFEGTNYTDAQLIEALQPIVALMEDDIRTLRKAYRAYMRGNLEKARSIAAPFDEISMEEYLDRIGASGWVRTFLNVASGSNGGLEPGQQTAINIIGSVYLEPPSMYLFDEGEERYKIAGGCQGIVRGLADGLDEGQVKPAHRLEAVKSSGDGFTLTFQDPKGSALDVEADFVIMTVPFTMLRKVEMQMEMPPEKNAAREEESHRRDGLRRPHQAPGGRRQARVAREGILGRRLHR
jgi:monoamine oxidase